MVKRISIKNPKLRPESAEDWISDREGMKRLTIDVPLPLHARLKITSVKNGQTMGEIVRNCIEKHLEEKDT